MGLTLSPKKMPKLSTFNIPHSFPNPVVARILYSISLPILSLHRPLQPRTLLLRSAPRPCLIFDLAPKARRLTLIVVSILESTALNPLAHTLYHSTLRPLQSDQHTHLLPAPTRRLHLVRKADIIVARRQEDPSPTYPLHLPHPRPHSAPTRRDPVLLSPRDLLQEAPIDPGLTLK